MQKYLENLSAVNNLFTIKTFMINTKKNIKTISLWYPYINLYDAGKSSLSL